MTTPTLDRETVLTLDRVDDVGCEAYGHPLALDGHVPSQRASFLVHMPCGHSYPCCAGRVARYRVTQHAPGLTTVHCPCNAHHDVRDVTWTDLP